MENITIEKTFKFDQLIEKIETAQETLTPQVLKELDEAIKEIIISFMETKEEK